jgi:hypothetical protein
VSQAVPRQTLCGAQLLGVAASWACAESTVLASLETQSPQHAPKLRRFAVNLVTSVFGASSSLT